MKLKTLKEVLHNERYDESKDSEHWKNLGMRELAKELKAEAVKWYKRHNRISKTMKPYLVQEFIKHFFNLTEEDLK